MVMKEQMSPSVTMQHTDVFEIVFSRYFMDENVSLLVQNHVIVDFSWDLLP